MLKEYLLRQCPAPIWSDCIPGVQTCRFSFSGQEVRAPIPICTEPFHFEVLFCLRGQLVLQSGQESPSVLEAPGILFLSHALTLQSCQHSADLSGILIAVDGRRAGEGLQTVCAALGMELDTALVGKRLEAQNGCIPLSGTVWTRAWFEALQSLPEEAQPRYCVFKAVELLYLLCTEREPDGCAAPRMLEIRTYLLENLAQKHTIFLLCRRFSISPTLLKEQFRQAFGMPIHSWLVQQRLNRARELICTTGISVQEAARCVGYEGTSQFYTAFRKQFGVTPAQCRKMSETAAFRPF